MRKLLCAGLVLFSAATFAANTAATTAKPGASKTAQKSVDTLNSNFHNKTAQMSYAFGASLGQNIKNQGIKLNTQAFSDGLMAGISGQHLLLSEPEIKQAMQSFQQAVLKKAMAKQQALAAKNLNAGNQFLENNKTQTGIVSLPDGLQYKVLQPGSGSSSPTKDDTVKVDYQASTINGKIFDSSYKRGKPSVFKVSNMIRGFQEALLLMKTGGVWEVYIPADLAYGEHGVPGVIGPNEVLKFKIHLISILPSGDSSKS